MLTFGQLVEKLNAWGIVYPHLKDQALYNIKIDGNGMLVLSLEDATVTIPIT